MREAQAAPRAQCQRRAWPAACVVGRGGAAHTAVACGHAGPRASEAGGSRRVSSAWVCTRANWQCRRPPSETQGRVPRHHRAPRLSWNGAPLGQSPSPPRRSHELPPSIPPNGPRPPLRALVPRARPARAWPSLGQCAKTGIKEGLGSVGYGARMELDPALPWKWHRGKSPPVATPPMAVRSFATPLTTVPAIGCPGGW